MLNSQPQRKISGYTRLLKRMKLKILRNILLMSIVILLSALGGYSLGKRDSILNTGNLASGKLINTSVPETRDVDFGLFWEVWRRLEDNFIDKEKLNSQQMVYGAISGMVSSLGDPYTVFLPPAEQKESKEELGGTFEGIGAELGMKDKRIIVLSPLKDMPAEKAGIRTGDWIVKVDGEDTAGWTVPEAVNKIRGQGGTKVILTVLHESEDKTVEIPIIRGTVIVKTVELKKTSWKVDENRFVQDDSCSGCQSLYYLKLSRFGDQTNSEWDEAVSEINKQTKNGDIKGVVLDLRNNPGGYLKGAVFIAGEFLKEGTLVVKQAYTSGEEETYSVTRKGKLLDIPLTVLINRGSASASEIVAGALRDHGRAKLIGEKSFGKGSIQQAQELPGGAGLHITIAKWLLPKGDWINSVGVSPDVEATQSLEQAAADAPDSTVADQVTVDEQLEEAANNMLRV